MIGPEQVVIGVVMGSVLIALGLIPGLFQGLTDGVRNYLDLASTRFPGSYRQRPPLPRSTVRRPVWLAALGAMLVALTVLAYLPD